MHILPEGSNQARIKTSLGGGVLDTLRSVPGGVTWADRDAIVDLIPDNVEYLQTKFPDAEWDPSFAEIFAVWARDAEEAKDAEAKRVAALDLDGDDFEYGTAPDTHQRIGFLLGRDLPGFMYFMEPGTGKSKILVDTAAHLYKTGKIKGILIAAENGLHLEWPAEFAKHAPKWLRYRAEIYRSGMGKKRKEAMADLVKTDCLRLVMLNLEALSHKSGRDFAEWFLKSQPTLFCVDESQLIGVPSSTRTRNAVTLAKLAPYRRILSGTPVAEGIERLYSQCRFTDDNILRLTRYSTFKHYFTKQVGRWNKIVGYKNVDELMRRIGPYSYFKEKKDCMDLPERTFERLTVEMSDEQARMYGELKSQYTVEVLEGKWVEAELAVARLVKLQQIASGFVRVEGENVIFSNTPRLKVMVSMAEQARRKIVIWCAFKANVEMIHEALDEGGIGSALYYGEQDAIENSEALREWRKPTGPKALVLTLKKGIRGLTMNEADTMFYYSHTWSNEARTQSLERNYRRGQDLPTTVFDFVAPGTVDVKILRALEKKQSIKELLKSPQTVKEWLDIPLEVR
jgi:SNF2 family DNA or RNA helicase